MTYESYEIAGKQLKLTAVISRVFKSCIEVPMCSKLAKTLEKQIPATPNAWICSEFSAPVR